MMKRTLLIGAALLVGIVAADAQPKNEAIARRLNIALEKFFHYAGELEGTKCESDAPQQWPPAKESIKSYLAPAWPSHGAELLEALESSKPAYEKGWLRGNSFCKLVNLESAQGHATRSVAYWGQEVKRHAEMLR